MARTINEVAKTTVLMNGKQADDEIKKLSKSADDFAKKKREAFEKNDHTAYKKWDSELKNVNKQMKNMRLETQSVEAVLKNLNGASLEEIQKAANKASRELRKMQQTDPGFKEKAAQAKILNDRYRTMNNEMRGVQSTGKGFFGSMTDGFNKYFGIATAFIASITGVALGFKKLAQDIAALDDVYSDVMKTTGMTRDKVLDLNESFKQMDTRSTREQLNMLARDAGKLGITGKEDILGFVEAGNQINVALGEDLGADAIKQIGKMVERYRLSTNELKGLDLKGEMLAIGSAINELGASSTASEPYLVQFSGRLGGVAAQAKISMSAILGYASALDQDMQAVEMSATALQKFIMKLMGDPAKFAKLAGLEVKGFTELLNTDANTAIKSVLRALNEKGGFQQLIPIFQDMGLDGARAVGVLSAMAGSIDKIEAAQVVANKAMLEGVSITNEYDIKNTNLQAKLDKARKAFREKALELGAHLSPALMMSTNLMTYLIKVITVLIDVVPKISTALIAVAGYTLAYNAALIKKNALLVINNLLLKEGIGLKLKDVVVLQYMIAKEQLGIIWKTKSTVATKLAATAQWLWNAAVAANPIGALFAALTTLFVAIKMYDKYNAESVRLEKEKNKAIEDNIKVNSKLELIYKNQGIAIEQLSKFSKAQKEALYEQTQATIQQAEAELVLMEAEQKRVESDNRRATLWEKVKNAFLSAGNISVAEARNIADAFNNGQEAASGLSESLSGVRSQISSLKTQSRDLKNIMDAPKEDGSGGAGGGAGGDADNKAFEEWKAKNQTYRDLLALTAKEIEAVSKVISKSDMRPDGTADMDDFDLLPTAMAAQKLALAKQRADGIIDQKTYFRLLEELEVAHIMQMIEFRKKTGQDTTAQEAALAEIQIKKRDSEESAGIALNNEIKDAAIQSAQIASDAIFQINANRINQELDETLSKINAQREAELSNANLTEEQKNAINEKYRKKEAAAKRAAWIKERNAAIAQAIINGALAVTKTFAVTGFTPVGWVAAGLQAVATAAQIAVIASQKPPQFKKGGYTAFSPSNDRAVGVVHANEFVGNAMATANPTVRPVFDLVNYAQQNGTISSLNLPAAIAATSPSTTSAGKASSVQVEANAEIAATMREAVEEFKKTVMDLAANGIEGKWVYQDFKKMADKETKAIKNTN